MDWTAALFFSGMIVFQVTFLLWSMKSSNDGDIKKLKKQLNDVDNKIGELIKSIDQNSDKILAIEKILNTNPDVNIYEAVVTIENSHYGLKDLLKAAYHYKELKEALKHLSFW